MTGTHYVNNKQLYEAMCEYIAKVREAESNGHPQPPVPKYIAECILNIATRMSKKHNYRNNSHYEEEMAMDGVENCLRYIKNFDPSKSNNPFAYFSQTCSNAFNRRIEKEKLADYSKHMYATHCGVIMGLEDIVTDANGEERAASSSSAESISDFITSFEAHLERKKAKRKQSAEAKRSIIEELGDQSEEE